MAGIIDYNMADGFVGGAVRSAAIDGGLPTVPGIILEDSLNDIDPAKSDDKGCTFAYDPETETIMTVHPVTGFLSYQHSPPQAGDSPAETLGSLEVRALDNTLLFSLSGFSSTFAALTGFTTAAQVFNFFFGGDNRISLNKSNNFADASSGNDTVYAGAGNDTIYGGAGNDGLNGDAGTDRLFGVSGSDGMFGGIGNDFAYGGDGHDTVQGGDGNDTLRGDAGNDRIIGGFGRDTLTGGSGRDTFVYQTLSKFNGKESGITSTLRDTITDFRHGQDKIDPSFILVPKFKYLGAAALTGLGQIHYKFVGHDTLVEISTDADKAAELSILLKGHIQLSASDFVL